MTRRLLQIRWLSLLIATLSGLFVMKVMGLFLNGGYLFDPRLYKEKTRRVGTSRLLTGDPIITGTSPSEKEDDETSSKDGSFPENRLSEESDAKKGVLESLQKRRLLLEKKANELSTREKLLKAAEMKLQKQLSRLQEKREQGDGVGDEEREGQKRSVGDQLKTLVIVYETMKPRDAAKVLDLMAPEVLYRLASQMDPKKLSPIMGFLSPKIASRLTMFFLLKGEEKKQETSPKPSAAMAKGSQNGLRADEPSPDIKELQRIKN